VNNPAIPEIEVAELAAALDEGAVLLDVRTIEEVEEARVPGIVHIPLDELEGRLVDVPNVSPVYVICRSGARSMGACSILVAAGRDVVNVSGGTLAWIESGRSVDAGPVRG
jgi:rhodanese-related sulfurtransferase